MSIENDLSLIQDFDKNYYLQVFNPLPVAFVKGKGCYLTDTQGTKYIDMIGGIAVNSLGHAHPKLVGAIKKQAGELIPCCNYYYIPGRSELAYKLCKNSFADKALGTTFLELTMKALTSSPDHETFIGSHEKWARCRGRECATEHRDMPLAYPTYVFLY